MNILRFAAGIAILFFAAMLQFWFASGGIFISLIFATLITIAFVFDLREVFFSVLLGIFIINWEPHINWEVFVFAAVPLAVFALRRFRRSSWQTWAGNGIAIFFGIVVFYLTLAPRMFLQGIGAFFIDLVASLIFGTIVFAVLNRRVR